MTHDAEMVVTLLDRDMYTEADAARLLRVPPSTLHYWLEGGTVRGKRYRPVIRPERRGERILTWGEFIEAGFLAQYRRSDVPMRELRSFIERLRDELAVPYPLAHARPFVGVGRRLLLAAQEAAALDADWWLVAVASDQLVLTPASDAFYRRVVWAGDEAGAWRPHDENSPVRIDPELRAGQPAVGGIRTETIWEHLQAGETPEEVADAFGVTPADVEWARAYEWTSRSALAA